MQAEYGRGGRHGGQHVPLPSPFISAKRKLLLVQMSRKKAVKYAQRASRSLKIFLFRYSNSERGIRKHSGRMVEIRIRGSTYNFLRHVASLQKLKELKMRSTKGGSNKRDWRTKKKAHGHSSVVSMHGAGRQKLTLQENFKNTNQTTQVSD